MAPATQMGFRLGVVVFPIIALAAFLACFKFYPLGKDKVKELEKEKEKVHKEKAKKLEEMTGGK